MSNLQSINHPPPPPDRPQTGHKGTFGTVIVVGGCATMMGAPALCASAAFRSGTGLVKIATDPLVLPTAITIEPGATGVLLSNDTESNVYQIDQADPSGGATLAVGPGLGRAEDRGELVRALLKRSRTVVLDADGLNLLAKTGRPRPHAECRVILTPHPGEFRRLAKAVGIKSDPTDPGTRRIAATQLADIHRAVVVLKGPHTVVSDGQRVYVNPTGNPALAVAGSGDVLTGAVAGFVAQGMAPFDAACLGVYLHGLAGDLWADRQGRAGMTARHLAKLLVEALHQHRQACDGEM